MIVLNNVIRPDLLRAAVAAWPSNDWLGWHRYQSATANKFGSLTHADIPRACRVALEALADKIGPYIDPSFIDYDLHGAGLHTIPPGGFLAGHVDAECHPLRPWRRTHSIVLGCNEHWPSQWDGRLYLQGHAPRLPAWNTAIMFETPNQWHEVQAVSESATESRKTLALFAWRIDADCHGKTSAQFASTGPS